MKFESEIEEILKKSIPKEEWMTEEEYQELLLATLKGSGTTKQMMSDAIQQGIENGHSLDVQMKVIRDFFKNK